jgi:hypothetical protein
MPATKPSPVKPASKDEISTREKTPGKYGQLTQEQIITALKAAAGELGHTPNSIEFRGLTGITRHKIVRCFETYQTALYAAGLTPGGMRIETAVLLEDWGKVVRKIDGVPSEKEYLRTGNYSRDCFIRRVHSWSRIPAEFCKFVAGGGLAGDWTDVLEKIRQGPIPAWGKGMGLVKKRAAVRARYAAQEKGLDLVTETAAAERESTPQCAGLAKLPQDEIHKSNPQILPPPLHGKKCVTATMLAVFVAELAPSAFPWINAACFPRRVLQDRPLLGAPMQFPGLAFEPVNEMGVMVLFSMMSWQLGFVIESVQAGFPDCHAKLEVEPGRSQDFRVEFEYESRNFKLHGHDPLKCDLIVCWRHNWKDCPPHLQVLELSKIVGKLKIG